MSDDANVQKLVVGILFILGFISLAAADAVRDRIKLYIDQKLIAVVAARVRGVWVERSPELIRFLSSPLFRYSVFCLIGFLVLFLAWKSEEILQELSKSFSSPENARAAPLLLRTSAGIQGCSNSGESESQLGSLSSSYFVVLPGNGAAETFRGARWKFDGWAGPKGKNIINGLVVSSEATGEVLLDVEAAQTGRAISFKSGRCEIELELALNESLAKAGFILVRYTVVSIKEEPGAPDCVFPPVV